MEEGSKSVPGREPAGLGVALLVFFDCSQLAASLPRVPSVPSHRHWESNPPTCGVQVGNLEISRAKLLNFGHPSH
jgi:hypothetical protein